MNVKKLKELAEKNETAKRILSMVGDRQRNTVYTAFSGLRADLKKRDQKEVDRSDFDSTFQALEKIGAGKLECSPKGTCLGFHWSVPIRDVAFALKNQDQVQKPKTILRATPNVPFVSSDDAEKQPATIIILRKGKGADTYETDEAHASQIASSLTH